MANRLSKIVTRTGDQGTTGLGDGSRIPKSAPRVVAMGDIDELNSQLGVLRCESLSPDVQRALDQIQHRLFDLGGEISIPGYALLTSTHVAALDADLAELNATLPPLKEFVLPGGARAAAICHVARAVARRAERSVVGLSEAESINPQAIPYLNRLSDFLFVLARTLNRDAGEAEILWKREAAPEGTAVMVSS